MHKIKKRIQLWGLSIIEEKILKVLFTIDYYGERTSRIRQEFYDKCCDGDRHWAELLEDAQVLVAGIRDDFNGNVYEFIEECRELGNMSRKTMMRTIMNAYAIITFEEQYGDK